MSDERTEVRGQKSEVRSRRSEDEKTEIRGRKSEVDDQRSDMETKREKYLKIYHGKMFLRNRLKSYLTG